MELICPDCRAPLVIADRQNATCAAHDGRYQILFDRSAPAMPETAAADGVDIPRPAAPHGLNIPCVQHPEVMAVARCRICSRGVCATCDFLLPGNVHACPACLETEPSTALTPKRRAAMIIAMLIAGFCTLMFMLLMTGTLHRTFGASETTNLLVGNAILWPAIAGVVVALTALDRRLGNPAGVWVAVAWNAVNLSIFLLLMVVGLMQK
jgi:hypothetical protein